MTQRTKDTLFAIALFATLGGMLFALLAAVSSYDEERQAAKTPLQRAEERCINKRAGSRPACWSEGDWQAFCKHTTICKPQYKQASNTAIKDND